MNVEGSGQALAGFKISEWLWSIPLIHIGSTIGYLWAYSVFFGSNMLGLISSSDIANTAIRNMPLVYLICAVSMVVGTLPHHRKAHNEVDAAKGAGKSFVRVILPVLIFTMIAVAVLAFGLWESNRDGGRPFYPLFALPLWMVVSTIPPIYIAVSSKARRQHVMIIVCISTVFSVAVHMGASAGQSDRYATYSDKQHPRAMCANSAVLRSIADGLLVVEADQSKSLLTKDCKPFLRLKSPEWWMNKHSATERDRRKAAATKPETNINRQKAEDRAGQRPKPTE